MSLSFCFYSISIKWKGRGSLFFFHMCLCVLVAQSCLTLWDSMNCSLPGSSVHGILQARILEWVTILFSREFPNPVIESGSLALQVNSLLSEPPGKPLSFARVLTCAHNQVWEAFTYYNGIKLSPKWHCSNWRCEVGWSSHVPRTCSRLGTVLSAAIDILNIWTYIENFLLTTMSRS